jgi:hypothetical protein
MGLMIIILVSLLVVVLVIRSKINNIHRMIEDKIHSVASIAGAGASIIKSIKKAKRS